jgi:hypothetical protein
MISRGIAHAGMVVVLLVMFPIGLVCLSLGLALIGLAAAAVAGTGAHQLARHAGWWRRSHPARSIGLRAAAATLIGILALRGAQVLLGGAAVTVFFLLVVSLLLAIPPRALRRPSAALSSSGPRSSRSAVPAQGRVATGRVERCRRSQARLVPSRPAPCPQLPVMSTEQLCWEWRRSYLAISQATGAAQIARIAAARAGILDELERRNPAGLQRWLASGARAAGDPTRHLSAG